MGDISARLSKPGTYILQARLDSPRPLKIGKLGEFDFQAGWYAYVGSAFGRGGLAGRLKHHCRRTERLHWHIDYLLVWAAPEFFWVATESTKQTEHLWATRITSLPGVRVPAPGFGASDCFCRTHLFHFEGQPDFSCLKNSGRTSIPILRIELPTRSEKPEALPSCFAGAETPGLTRPCVNA